MEENAEYREDKRFIRSSGKCNWQTNWKSRTWALEQPPHSQRQQGEQPTWLKTPAILSLALSTNCKDNFWVCQWPENSSNSTRASEGLLCARPHVGHCRQRNQITDLFDLPPSRGDPFLQVTRPLLAHLQGLWAHHNSQTGPCPSVLAQNPPSQPTLLLITFSLPSQVLLCVLSKGRAHWWQNPLHLQTFKKPFLNLSHR